MRTVKVRNTVLGEGLPKICVPITGTSEMEIKTQAEAAALAGADLVEWRADYLKPALLNERELFRQSAAFWEKFR